MKKFINIEINLELQKLRNYDGDSLTMWKTYTCWNALFLLDFLSSKKIGDETYVTSSYITARI